MKRACADVPIDFVGSQSSGPPGWDDPEHEGHIGWTIARVAARANEWTTAAAPDIVLLMLGTNDIAIGTDLPSAQDRLAQLVRTVHAVAPRAKILVSTLPPLTRDPSWNARVDRFNARLQATFGALAGEGVSVTVTDVGSSITPAELRDGVHPSAEGNERLGAAWCHALRDAVGRSPSAKREE